ncbi:MAG: hypothetical protein ACOX3P_07460 [Saccharofermentanales bacterium]|jgi:hypothetical protein|nr:hypothetical protein [Bacillota bacterium]NLB08756.1 hypothetical protein [Clostridiales bacterium]
MLFETAVLVFFICAAGTAAFFLPFDREPERNIAVKLHIQNGIHDA